MKKRILTMLGMMMLSTALVACSGDGNRTSDEVTNDVVTEDTAQNATDDTATQDNVSETPAENDGAEEQETQDAESADVDSTSILSDVWATYGEDEKFYGMGGDMNNMVENAPGLFSLEDKDALAATLLVQSDAAGMIDEAASFVHGMNLNTFTGAAYHLTDPADKQAFADSMKNTILNNQWMCGSPDQYVIYSVSDDYVVVAFGAIDIMKVFKEKFMTVHGDVTEVLYEENVAQ
ncbi:MAG: hypothetical protein IJ429_00400 [Lachnospiraceae bacterium]|nr:hypothetical protein [Lachnospiraceae bacterium]